jgi:hypothetical protein
MPQTIERQNPTGRGIVIPLAIVLCGAAVSCSPDYSLWAGDAQASAAARDDARLVSGELTTLTSRRLTVETRGDEVVLGVDDGVQITIDGKRARLRDLQPKQFVEIETEREGHDLLASVITARSRMQDRAAADAR